MNLICFCGPHASGKGEVASSVFQFFGEDILERVVPCTTRPPRPGESHGREYYFISEEEFSEHLVSDGFAFWTQIRADQRSGTLKGELFGKPRALVDIVSKGARAMRDVLLREGKGEALLIFIHASKEERRRRIMERDHTVTPEKLDAMMGHDPVDDDLEYYKDFDVIIENPDGKLVDTVSTVTEYIRRFLHT